MPRIVAAAAAVFAHLQCFARYQAARNGGLARPGCGAAGRKAGASGIARPLALFELERWRMDRLSRMGRSAVPETGAVNLAGEAEGSGWIDQLMSRGSG